MRSTRDPAADPVSGETFCRLTLLRGVGNMGPAMNGNTFLRPEQFRRFVYPYAKALVSYIRSRGPWVTMHSDGNLMGILNQILDIGPDILQSIDPMAGIDIRRVKQIAGGRMGLMGNVQCSLLQDGPEEQIIA